MITKINNLTNSLTLKRLGIDTLQEFVVYMRAECHVCISEGFKTQTRINISVKNKTAIATLNVIYGEILHHGEASLSESVWKYMNAEEGDEIIFSHLQPIHSLSDVRAKMYGGILDYKAAERIISDIAEGKYSNIHLAAFVTACAGERLNVNEITALTTSMVNVGSKLNWDSSVVADKHCVGGLPGNRTTPIVVAIAAAAGLTIPKTSSKAITSPAGTADTMAVFTEVDLSLAKIKEVIEKEQACIAWGGGVKLSPVDDVLIRIGKALDVDSEGQMIASVLSKKVAAGSTHVIIDIPVGATAKVRTLEKALKLKYYFYSVGNSLGLKLKVVITDGNQPVGRGVGPALEAMDVLSVLRNEPQAPKDLLQRACFIAGALLELCGNAQAGKGEQIAMEIVKTGKAWNKFYSICMAQGGFREPKYAPFSHVILAECDGVVSEIDNRKLAMAAKLCGAPDDKSAGILFNAPLEKTVNKGDTLFTIYADSKGELNYAIEYIKNESKIITIK